jgi:cell division protein FtsL
MRYILYGLLIWFLYNLVFRFIIPVYKTTRQMKKKFGEMHDRVQEEQAKQQGFSQSATEQKSTSKAPSGDYIDFEEVK